MFFNQCRSVLLYFIDEDTIVNDC